MPRSFKNSVAEALYESLDVKRLPEEYKIENLTPNDLLLRMTLDGETDADVKLMK